MNAVIAEKIIMGEEDRIARVESDVAELKGDVKTLSKCVSEFKTEVAKEFAAVREEMAKEFGAVREEMATEFGAMRTSIERLKVWMLGTGISTVLGIAILVGLKLH